MLVIFLVLSAFFSGSEVSLFSLEKKKLKDLKNGGITSRYILNLLDTPRRLLVTILLGNTLINVAASIVAVSLALDFSAAFGYSLDLILLIEIVLLTVLILIFGEIIPKVWASKYPLQFSKLVSIPLYWTSVLIYPVSKILSDSIRVVFRKFKNTGLKTAISSSELADLANLGVEKGALEEEEQELIHGIVSFKTVTAKEVMTPRVDLTSVSIDTSFEELMKTITESGHSRIPLYEKDLDDIVGIIYAKDLLPLLKDKSEVENLSLNKIARKAMFIPETKLINELLQEFQLKKMHVGIVVDEYGGTAGLITLEDILEEIVGEIHDEYDKEEDEITKINDHSYLLLGKLPIDELEDLLDTKFEEDNDEFETVGGFILDQAGTIPEAGYSVKQNGYRFTVKAVENKRIEKVLVEAIDKKETEE